MTLGSTEPLQILEKNMQAGAVCYKRIMSRGSQFGDFFQLLNITRAHVYKKLTFHMTYY